MSWEDMMEFKIFSWTVVNFIIFKRMNGSILLQWILANVLLVLLLWIKSMFILSVDMMDNKDSMQSKDTILKMDLGNFSMSSLSFLSQTVHVFAHKRIRL